jgi:hypothetical protein
MFALIYWWGDLTKIFKSFNLSSVVDGVSIVGNKDMYGWRLIEDENKL